MVDEADLQRPSLSISTMTLWWLHVPSRLGTSGCQCLGISCEGRRCLDSHLGAFNRSGWAVKNKSAGCDEPLTWCSKTCYVLVLDGLMGYPWMGMTWEQAMLLQWGREMHSLCAQRCPNFLLFCTLGRLILCQLSLAVHTFHSLNCFCFRPSFTLLFT